MNLDLQASIFYRLTTVTLFGCVLFVVGLPCQFVAAQLVQDPVVQAPVVQTQFVHPGVAHSRQSLAFVKAKIDAKEEPWLRNWQRLKKSEHAELDWKPMPYARVERGPYNHPNIGSSEFSEDAMAAYVHALCWNLSGEEAHARKSAEILDAWSGKLEVIGNHDAALLVGMGGFHYCIAAELIKHTWDGWPESNQARFAKICLLYTSPSPRDQRGSRMPSSA